MKNTEVVGMKVKVVVNVKNAYCNAKDVAEALDEMNYFESVRALDDECVELVINEDNFKMLKDERMTIESMLRDVVNNFTEAEKNIYVYEVLDIDDIIESIEVLDVNSLDDLDNDVITYIYEDESTSDRVIAVVDFFAIDDTAFADELIRAIARKLDELGVSYEIADRIDSANVIVLK